jgi:hypothetical protein
MHRLTAVLAALAGAAYFVTTAPAERPSRQPLPAPPTFTISGSCAFDVQVDVLANKEYVTTFTSGKQIITGRLVVRLTNAAHPQKSVVLNVSGPGIEDVSNPSVFNLSGTSLIFFPGTLELTKGPISLTFDENGNITSFSETSAGAVDLCAVLDP